MTEPQNPPADQAPAQVEVTDVDNEQPAVTAGEESHANPEKLRGDEADAPADTGKPPQEN
jgi:hypothetical protein